MAPCMADNTELRPLALRSLLITMSITMLAKQVGVYKTRQEATHIVDCEREDLVLKTARRLVNAAVGTLMQIHRIDRRAAYG